jgi:alkanesulfonate monooxygenase SsuD/methylene tetrahydromethanopterin reductase-like flavin-dependent oxidoreductase (luciferase family)
MRFLLITLIVHAPDPITGKPTSTADRFSEVIANARLAEELGFDGFGVGERHERPFISSSPPVVLSHASSTASSGCRRSSPTSTTSWLAARP